MNFDEETIEINEFQNLAAEAIAAVKAKFHSGAMEFLVEQLESAVGKAVSDFRLTILADGYKGHSYLRSIRKYAEQGKEKACARDIFHGLKRIPNPPIRENWED